MVWAWEFKTVWCEEFGVKIQFILRKCVIYNSPAQLSKGIFYFIFKRFRFYNVRRNDQSCLRMIVCSVTEFHAVEAVPHACYYEANINSKDNFTHRNYPCVGNGMNTFPFYLILSLNCNIM